MFKKIMLIILIIAGCKSESKKDLPENAIDTKVIDNPVTASNKNSKNEVPVFQFEEVKHNFGTIEEGEKISFAYRFKNVGTGTLVIRAAQGSCGCTVPEYPKDPIEPGQGGVINVTFNSEGKTGEQHKTVTIISNTMPNTFTLEVSGTVNPKK